MRFLVDENVPRQIGQFLQAEGHDVLIVRDSGLVGAPDAEIWDCAVREQRIIVTQDRGVALSGSLRKRIARTQWGCVDELNQMEVRSWDGQSDAMTDAAVRKPRRRTS